MDKLEQMAGAFSVFHLVDLARVKVVKETMDLHGLTFADLDQYLDDYKNSRIHKTGVPRGSLGQCPLCGKELFGKRLPKNDRGWIARIFCTGGWDEDNPEGICGYELLTTMTILQVQVQVIREAMKK